MATFKQRVLILSSRVGSGHIAAAAALEQAFQAHGGAEVLNADAMDFSTRAHELTYNGIYFPMARVAPWLMEGGYQASNQPFATEPTLPLWDRLNAAPLARLMRSFNPDAIICTHFMPARLAGHLLERGQLHASLSVVLTDYDFHGIWLGRTFSRYFVALEETRAHCLALGLPAERVVTSGIPVAPAFALTYEHSALLAKHGLRSDLPLVLVSAGAAGRGPVLHILEQLRVLETPLQVLVVCGRNEELRRAVALQVADRPERFRVLGFTREMPELMRLATLFIGKPGGLTAAECMASGLPMLLIEPLPGQEDRNSTHLLEEGAAMGCNELTTVGYKVARVLGEPGLLARMQAAARRLGRPDAAASIAAVVLAEPLSPLQLGRAERKRIVARAALRGELPLDQPGQLRNRLRGWFAGVGGRK